MNKLGACVRGPESGLNCSMDEVQKKSTTSCASSGGVGGGGGATDKATPSLSIDRAAFLILRVKKAFKKKRQQRKDRQ